MQCKCDVLPVKWSEVLNRDYAWPLAIICLSVCLHALDTLVVATMMLAIVADTGGANLVSWTVSLYEVGSIVASAASGLLALRYGLRIPMFVATLVFVVGCIIAAFAPEMWIVLAGRLLQGLGGGGLLAFSFVAAVLLFPKRLIARVMGTISALWGVSAFVGPLLGGLFVEFATWRIGFGVFALMAGVLSVGVMFKIERRAEASSQEKNVFFPFWRLLWLSISITSIAYADVEISPISTPAFILFGGFCFLLFLKLDAGRDEDRLLPLNPLSLLNPVGASLLMIICFSAASVALSVYGTLLITNLHGVSVLVAGYVIACPAIGWSIASVLVSGLAERHDGRMISMGMVLVALGLTGYVYSVPNGPIELIVLFAIIEGAGFGIAWAFIPRAVSGLAKPAEVERTSGAVPTAQAIGYALGAAYIGIVANASGFDGDGEKLSTEFSAIAIFSASIPFILLGLLATRRFVSARPV